MSKLARLRQQLESLDQIGNILTAMKNLALMEMTKVSRFMTTQKMMMQTVRAVGADFINHNPGFLPHLSQDNPTTFVLIGSERGFCAEINDNIINQIRQIESNSQDLKMQTIIVGRKLEMLFLNDLSSAIVIEGASTAEEIPNVINSLLSSLESLSSSHPGSWVIIFNEDDQNKMTVHSLRPFVEFELNQEVNNDPPFFLNLSENEFFANYSENYLFTLLNSVFYLAFFAENTQRLHHLEGAIDRLEKDRITLNHHYNLLRQEAITEEINVIMISAEEILKELTVSRHI